MYTYIIHTYFNIHYTRTSASEILVQEYWCGTEAAWNIMDAVIIVVSLVETAIDIWAQAGRWGWTWGPFKSFQLSLESKVKVIYLYYLYQNFPGITIKYTII